MAFIVPVTSAVAAQQTVQMPINSAQVNGVYYNFDRTTCVAGITYGNTDAAGVVTPEAVESWKLSGVYYLANISKITTGLPIAQELFARIEATVIEIVSNPTLKAQLIASGELVVVPADLLRIIG